MAKGVTLPSSLSTGLIAAGLGDVTISVAALAIGLNFPSGLGGGGPGTDISSIMDFRFAPEFWAATGNGATGADLLRVEILSGKFPTSFPGSSRAGGNDGSGFFIFNRLAAN